MASCTIWLRDVRRRRLPAICFHTGRPADAWISYRLLIEPGPPGGRHAVAWMLVLVGIPVLPVERPRVEVSLPCARVVRRARVVWAAAWALAATAVVTALPILGAGISPYVLAAPLAGAAVLGVVGWCLARWQPLPRGRVFLHGGPDEFVLLGNVHAAFADAVKAMYAGELRAPPAPGSHV